MLAELAPLALPALSIALLVALIVAFRFHPFVALVLASAFLGLASGLGVDATVKAFQRGVGGILGSTGVIVGLGAMLGGLLLDSGGADRIAEAFTAGRSRAAVPAAICAAALVVGLPHLFDVSFVMFAPLAYVVAARSGVPLLGVALPVAAGLMVSHGLLPPHPSPTLAIAAYHADAGRTVMFGLAIAVPMAVLSGPLLARALAPTFPPRDPAASPLLATRHAPAEGRRQATTAMALVSVLLPPALMMLRTFGRAHLPDGVARDTLDLFGDPMVSLLVAVLFAAWALGLRTGATPAALQSLLGRSLAPVAGVLLILGAGGGLKEELVAAHVGDAVVGLSRGLHLDPLVLAWSLAAMLRVAVGSATVATATAAGIVAPLAAAGGTDTALLVLATSSGGIGFSHLNDSGFWLFKEYYGLTVGQTLRSWTLLVSLQALIGLAGVLALRAAFG